MVKICHRCRGTGQEMQPAYSLNAQGAKVQTGWRPVPAVKLGIKQDQRCLLCNSKGVLSGVAL